MTKSPPQTWGELLKQVEAAIKRERIIDPCLWLAIGFTAGWLFSLFTIVGAL